MKTHLRIFLLSTASMLAFIGCDSGKDRGDFQKSVKEARSQKDATLQEKQARWTRFSKDMGIAGFHNTQANLFDILKTPPQWTPDFQKNLLENVAQDAFMNLPRMQGKDLKKFQFLEEDADSRLFLIQYTNNADDLLQGLVSLPKKSDKVSLVDYFHGGDTGLSYKQIKRVTGDATSKNIFLMPAGQGECICKGFADPQTGCDDVWSEAIGTQEGQIWNGDSYDMLSLYSIVMKNLMGTPASEEGQTLFKELAPFMPNLATVDYLGRPGTPHVVFGGHSRGGLTAIVAASTNTLVYTIGCLAKKANKWPPHFQKYDPAPISALSIVAAPFTVMMGQMLLVIKHAIMGDIRETIYGDLPGIRHLISTFEAHHATLNNPKSSTKAATLEVAKRDGLVHAPGLALIENIFILYHEDDGLINISQKALVEGTLDRISADPSIKKAVNEQLKSFGVKKEFTGWKRTEVTLLSPAEKVKGALHHFDAAYFKSKSAQGKTGAEHFSEWIEQTKKAPAPAVIAAGH